MWKSDIPIIEWNINEYLYSIIKEADLKIREKRKKMEKELKTSRKSIFDKHTFILTQDEIKKINEQIHKEAQRESLDAHFMTINKNGIFAQINKRKQETIFRYKDWPVYTIDAKMNKGYRKGITLREKEIIMNCIEAWLHYKWIAKIFWTSHKIIHKICKKLWAENVFLTSQKVISKLPRIKVLDEDGFFVIEKENHLLKK